MVLALIPIAQFSVPLFHTLVELFAIAIALIAFVVAWNTYSLAKNNYLLLLGCGYLCVALLDLAHTLTFSGFPVFSNLTSNVTINFWIVSRFFEAIILLVAPLAIYQRIQPTTTLLSLFLLLAISFAIVIAELLPLMYIEGQGPTSAKITAEFIVVAILIGALFTLYNERKKLDGNIRYLIDISIVFTIAAELSFTLYTDLQGFMLIVGHFLKLLSFWAVYVVLIESSLKHPFKMLTREANTYDAVPDEAVIIDSKGKVRQVNKAVREQTDLSTEQCLMMHCHQLQHLKNQPIEECEICQAINNNLIDNNFEFYQQQQKQWYEVSLSRISVSNSFTGAVHIRRNITKQKLAQARAESLNHLYMMLSHTNKVISLSASQEVMFKEICHIAVSKGGFKMAWIGLLKSTQIKPLVYAGDTSGYLDTMLIDLNNELVAGGPVGKAARLKQVSYVNNTFTHPDFLPWRDAAITRGYQSLAAVPIIVNGKVIAIFTLYSSVKRAFDIKMLSLLTMLGGDISSAIELRQEKDSQEKIIKNLAFYDPLTNLPNRRLLTERIEQAIEQCQRYRKSSKEDASQNAVAIMVFDLDNFKVVNDSLGHKFGDELLKIVASIFQQEVRALDTVSRQGGDEFTIVLGEVNDIDIVTHIARKILIKLTKPIEVLGHQVVIGASIGIALYPNDANTVDELLTHADMAMYQAKAEGKNNFQFYIKQMNQRANERLELENKLRYAIEYQQFQLYYQPQVNMATNELIGIEALIRWHVPNEGFIGPDVFIPFAEETGLIGKIGDWVINTACTQLRELQQKGFPEITVSVNVSAFQFCQGQYLVESIEQALIKSCLPSKCFAIELTESILISNVNEAINVLSALRGLGVKCAIDDFGTGYSSLSYIKKLPIDVLKIDQSFVRDISTDASDKAIVSAIIAMASKLELNVLAEGVESLAQQKFLLEEGCTLAQGYLYCKPLPMHELMPWLQLRGKHIAN